MKARILVVKGEPEYQILHEFAEAFTKALEGVGCIVQYVDLLEEFDANRIDKQIDAVEKSIELLLYTMKKQIFIDGNKRKENKLWQNKNMFICFYTFKMYFIYLIYIIII